MAIIYYQKKYGETLATMRKRFRSEYPEYELSKITYAGRLDPMASGLMIVLTDEDVHKKDVYTQLDKMYEVDFILGMATDTYDILGNIVHTSGFSDPINKEQDIRKLEEEKIQQYPPFSSKTTGGIPLWQQSRAGLPIQTIERPISVAQAEYVGCKEYTESEFNHRYTRIITSVQGDFRQDEIYAGWQSYQQIYQRSYIVYTARFYVSSGTYIRSLIHLLGQRWGMGAIAVHIRRKQIGDIHI